MRAVALRRLGTAPAGCVEPVGSLDRSRRDLALGQTRRSGVQAGNYPVVPGTARRVGIVDYQNQLLRLGRHTVPINAGETSSPLQVNWSGIQLPSSKSGVVICTEILLSTVMVLFPDRLHEIPRIPNYVRQY